MRRYDKDVMVARTNPSLRGTVSEVTALYCVPIYSPVSGVLIGHIRNFVENRTDLVAILVQFAHLPRLGDLENW
jgi:hypothetical protein